MTKEELQNKINEARTLNTEFEALDSTLVLRHEYFKEWLAIVEQDIDVIPEKIREIIGHNIDDLGLHNLTGSHYDMSGAEGVEKYRGDRISIEYICKNYIKSYQLYKSVGYAEKNTVIVGANGSGKTTLANNLKNTLNIQDGIVIPAQKLLLVPTFESIPKLGAEREYFLKYQNKIPDDKKTYMAKGIDDLPYDLTKEYGSEYRNVLAYLLAEKNSRHYEIYNSKKDGTKYERAEYHTTIDAVMDIWNDLITHRTMCLDSDCNLIIKNEEKCEEKSYEAYKMSDGERIILYLVGRVMQAPKNGLVIVDEPEMYLHRTVVDRLWDRLEKERPDCTFIYMTHDLQFATSRVGVKSWIKSYHYPSTWDIELIENKKIPEPLLMELLGSCKKILFCEGNGTTSHDKKIFEVLFPDYIIYPLGSCKDVINYTKAYNAIPNRNTKAFGIVDSDFRSPDEIDDLKTNQIYTYHVAEIENLFLVEDFLKGFKKYYHCPGEIEDIKNNILKKFERNKDEQASLWVSAYINHYYQKYHIANGKNKTEVEAKLRDFNSSIDIEKWYNDRLAQINHYITDRNYNKVILLYNNKGLHVDVEKEFQIKNYSNWAIDYLKTAPDKVLNCLRELFPAELRS